MHFVGRLDVVADRELVLTGTSWIACSSRWSDFLAGVAPARELEPYPGDGRVVVGRGAISDVCLWDHPLPTVAI